MPTAPLDLQIKVIGLGKLESLTKVMEDLDKQVGALQKQLPKATSEMGAFTRESQKGVAPVKGLSASLKGLVGQFAAFAGITLGATAAFKGLEKADKASAALRTLGVDSQKLGTELNELRQDLDNNVSGLELQQNAFLVAQAGFKDTAEITEILGNATKSAQAKLIDSTTTVQALSSVLRAYNLTAKDSKALSDKFFATIASGNLTLDQYASVIGGVAPLASAAGVAIEEVNAALAVITSQGSSAGEAATQVSSAISAIIGPSKQAKDLAKDLKIEFNEQALAAKGLAGVFKDVVEKTGGSSEKLITLFGSLEAVRGVVSLSTNDFKQYEKALDEQAKSAGKVDKAYKEISQTIQASLARVQNSFSALTQAIVVDAGPSIIATFDAIAGVIEALNSPIGKAVIQIGFFTAAIWAAKKAILALKATALAGWFKPIIAQLLLGNKAFATFILRTKAATLASKGLAAAMSALPWVGFIAGAIAAANATYQAWAAWAEFNRILEKAPLDEVKAKLKEVEEEQRKAETATVTWYEQILDFIIGVDGASTALDGLIARGKQLRSVIAGDTDLFPEQGADLDMDAIRRMSQQFENVDPPVVTATSGGGAAPKPKTDDLKGLERSRKLLEDMLPIKEQLNFAELEGNEILATNLQSRLEILQANKDGVDAIESLNTAEGKAIQTQINKLKLQELIETNAKNELQAVQARAEAQRDALRPLQEQRRILDATLVGRGEEERILIDIENIMKAAPGLEKSVVEELVRGNAERVKELKQLDEIKAFYNAISQTIQNGIVDAITAAIDGSKELSEVLSGVLRSLGQMFLKQGVGMVFSGLGFADGGRPPMNQASVIGERGPELFVPDSAGTVLPNDVFDAARAAMSFGADNDSSDGSELGSSISRSFADNTNSISTTNSYMRERATEINNQTALGAGGSMTIETQVINNVEYATVSQLEAASAASAKKARAQVFNDMKNRPAIRRQVGVN